jgi:hypothetical protein
MGIIIGLLILWLVLIVVGFVFKAVLWLAIIACIAFALTAASGVITYIKSPR